MTTAISSKLLSREQNVVKVLTGELLTREQAAEYLSIKPQTLAAWATNGRYHLPLVHIGRCVRYRRADLDKFIAENTVGAVEE